MVAGKDLNFGVPKSFDLHINEHESLADHAFELKVLDS